MPPLAPSGTLHFHIWLLLSLKLLKSMPTLVPVVNGRCSDPLLAHCRAHCPSHWQLHSGLAASSALTRQGLHYQLCLLQAAQAFTLHATVLLAPMQAIPCSVLGQHCASCTSSFKCQKTTACSDEMILPHHYK